MYAKVIVDVRNEQVDECFTYQIPSIYEDLDLVGTRVLVEFGYQKVLGYIIGLTDKLEFKGSVKTIVEILDFNKELNYEQLALAKYLKENTHCTMSQALQTMIPPILRSKSRKYIVVNDFNNIDPELGLLFAGKKRVLFTSELMEQYSKIKREIAKGTIELAYDIYSYGKQKRIKEYYVEDYGLISQFKSQKRKDVFEYLNIHKFSTISDIVENVSISDATIKLMEKEGYLKTRITFKNREYQLTTPREIQKLNTNEEQILTKYYETSGKPYLMQTNDETFKFAALTQMIKKEMGKQKKVLIVTPTIFSYRNVMNKLHPYISNYRVLGFNSKLNSHDFYENYMTLKNENYDIVITTKVGLFLPVVNLGLVVMIDEDNYNYINEQTPKFNSRLVALKRAEFHGARLVYTSDVPLLTSYYEVIKGKYYLLKNIVGKPKQPFKIDIRKNSAEIGIPSSIIEGIRKNLLNHKKSMLILNRKGYGKSLICRTCGKTLKCPKCQMPINYYKDKNLVKCNYCGWKLEGGLQCPTCTSNDIIILGLGLEQVKEKFEMSFPTARVLQIDSETLENGKNYEEIMNALDEEEYDIIVSTSLIMSISKINDLALVALLDSDSVLNLSDYRAREECFRLIAKVCNYHDADIYIHGYDLDNPTINQAIVNDYQNFSENELEYRLQFFYPPFGEINRLVVMGEYKDIYYYANYFKKVFNSIMPNEKNVVGPAYLPSVKGVQLILKHNDFNQLENIIREVNNKFNKYKILVNYERYPIRFY